MPPRSHATDTLPPEALEAWKMKELHCQTASSDNGDLNPTIFVVRDGEIHLAILCPLLDPDEGIRALIVVASEIAFDELWFMIETRCARESVDHPGFGPGELKRLALAGKAKQHGIRDVIMIARLVGDRLKCMTSLPYRWRGQGRDVEWFWNEFTTFDNRELEGVLVNKLRAVGRVIGCPSVTTMFFAEYPDFKAMTQAQRAEFREHTALNYLADTGFQITMRDEPETPASNANPGS